MNAALMSAATAMAGEAFEAHVSLHDLDIGRADRGDEHTHQSFAFGGLRHGHVHDGARGTVDDEAAHQPGTHLSRRSECKHRTGAKRAETKKEKNHARSTFLQGGISF